MVGICSVDLDICLRSVKPSKVTLKLVLVWSVSLSSGIHQNDGLAGVELNSVEHNMNLSSN